MHQRWLIDGMNVIGSRPDGWWNDPDKAMRRFTGDLDRFAAATGHEVTVVFDRRPREDPPSSDLVQVAFARRKGRNAADHEILEMAASDSDIGSLLVVTSDKRLAEDLNALQVKVVGAGSFRDRLEKEIRS